MSGASQLASQYGSIEFFICIEGVGWLTDERTGPSAGFSGDVFTTGDLNGDLAAKLGCTIHKTLQLPGGVEDSIDPLTGAYQVSGLEFEIVDDGFLASVSPQQAITTETTLSSDLAVIDTAVVTVASAGIAGDKVWIGARELVLLGAKSGAGPYTYTASTRGYLGTPTGRHDASGVGYTGVPWKAGAAVQSSIHIFFDRRVLLFAHAPGEAVSGCTRIHTGRVRGLSCDASGVLWKLNVVGEQVADLCGKVIRRPTHTAIQNGYQYTGPTVDGLWPHNSVTTDDVTGIPAFSRAVIFIGGETNDPFSNNLLYTALYQYRTEPGGTAGFLSTGTARTYGENVDVCASQLLVENIPFHAVGRYIDSDGNASPFVGNIGVDMVSPSGVWNGQVSTDASDIQSFKVKALLDSLESDAALSRFAVNGKILRNPIDVLLVFLLSTNGEFVVQDADPATSGTSIVFPNNTLGAANQWTDFAVHCVEGTSKGEARKILSNTAGVGNACTIERAFTADPDNLEVQIRNSIYDILPMGWGMGIPCWMVDIDSFLLVRDKYLADAVLGAFILGAQEKLNIFDLLMTNIAQPYGFMLYVDRTTGKLSCRYLGESLTDGIDEDYQGIGEFSVLDIGEMTIGVEQAIGSVNLKVRAYQESVMPIGGPTVIGSDGNIYPNTGGSDIAGTITLLLPNPDPASDPVTIRLTAPEIEAAIPADKLGSLDVSAMFNSQQENLDVIMSRAYTMLRRGLNPPPRLSFKVDLSFLSLVQAGFFISLTHSAIFNPLTATVGMTQQACRVLSTKIDFSESNPGLELEVEVLEDVIGALIAPAARVHGSGSDGFGDYINCDSDQYVNDTDNDGDHLHFAVNDVVSIFDRHGALIGSCGHITGFGTNFSSDPSTATLGAGGRCRIYVSDNTFFGSITADETFVTFTDFDSATNTSRMNNYCAWESGTTLPTAQSPKAYG